MPCPRERERQAGRLEEGWEGERWNGLHAHVLLFMSLNHQTVPALGKFLSVQEKNAKGKRGQVWGKVKGSKGPCKMNFV